MAIDITDAKELTLAINKNVAPGRFLTSFFKKLTHNTKDVLIDFVEGSQTLAPYIRDGQESTISNRGGYLTRSVHCYDISLKRKTNAFDALKRLPGEAVAVANAKNPSERCAELAARDMSELQGKVYRTIEKKISDALFTGSLDITDAAGNVIETVNLGMKDSHKLSKAWSSNGYKKIGSDIDAAAVLVARDSGLTATDVIFDSESYATASENDAFIKELDTRFVNNGALNNTVERNGLGARFMGMYKGMRVWRYDEVFKAADGNVYGIIPQNKVVVLSADLQATLHFGIAGDVEHGFFEGEFMADTWYEKDPSCQWIRVRSAPLPIIEQIDGVAVITVS